MANIKSAKKRIKLIGKKTLRNKIIRTRTRNAMKKVTIAAASGDVAAAKDALNQAVSIIDRAASKGVYHKNNASRKKSLLYRLVNKLGA